MKQSEYVEARNEALALWATGWITKVECRDILMALYRARYLMRHIRVLNLKPGRVFYER